MTVQAQIQANPRRIQHTSWKEYGVRFLFGGLITAAVGVLSQMFGPVVTGLFLAFPAILPASLTLIARHEDKSKAEQDALGAALGSIGLIAFGLLVWLLTPHLVGAVVLAAALIAWSGVALLCWVLYQQFAASD